jgi:hypothetical protein
VPVPPVPTPPVPTPPVPTPPVPVPTPLRPRLARMLERLPAPRIEMGTLTVAPLRTETQLRFKMF